MTDIIFFIVLGASALFDIGYLTYHWLTGAPLRCIFLPTEWCVRSGHRENERVWAWIFLLQGLAIALTAWLRFVA